MISKMHEPLQTIHPILNSTPPSSISNEQLVELLEVPQLMDACIRNGLYEPAVDIVAFANTLERRHLRQPPATIGPASTSAISPPGHAVVIAGLVQELRALQRQLRERLLQQLRLPIKLPRCLQVGKKPKTWFEIRR